MGVTAAIAAVAVAGAGGAMLGASTASKPNMPAAPPLAGESNQAAESSAQKEKERRRRLYAGLGRSSTILTGPSGLGAAPLDDKNTTPKQLLGL